MSPGFDFGIVCFDPMPCILEGGVLELALKDLLRWLVTNDVISLADINSRIRNWEFQLQTGDGKPPDIPDRVLTGGAFAFKAQALMTLADNILFILRDKEPYTEKHFRQYARCLRLSQAILKAPTWNIVNLKILKLRMVIFHFVRRSMYEWATMTPKAHYILHLIEQMIQHGAARYQSCIQFEKHYKVIKAKPLGCYKNVSYSLAYFHQRWQVGALFKFEDGKATSKNFEQIVQPVARVDRSDIPQDVLDRFDGEIFASDVLSCVKFGTCKFGKGDVIELGDLSSPKPEFGEIVMFLHQGSIYRAIVRRLEAKGFASSFGSFSVQPRNLDIVDFTNMEYKFVNPVFKEGDGYWVCRKYSSAVERI